VLPVARSFHAHVLADSGGVVLEVGAAGHQTSANSFSLGSCQDYAAISSRGGLLVRHDCGLLGACLRIEQKGVGGRKDG
jgi:hypothetical protein